MLLSAAADEAGPAEGEGAEASCGIIIFLAAGEFAGCTGIIFWGFPGEYFSSRDVLLNRK